MRRDRGVIGFETRGVSRDTRAVEVLRGNQINSKQCETWQRIDHFIYPDRLASLMLYNFIVFIFAFHLLSRSESDTHRHYPWFFYAFGRGDRNIYFLI